MANEKPLGEGTAQEYEGLIERLQPNVDQELGVQPKSGWRQKKHPLLKLRTNNHLLEVPSNSNTPKLRERHDSNKSVASLSSTSSHGKKQGSVSLDPNPGGSGTLADGSSIRVTVTPSLNLGPVNTGSIDLMSQSAGSSGATTAPIFQNERARFFSFSNNQRLANDQSIGVATGYNRRMPRYLR